MTQKIIKVGSSAAVTISKKSLAELRMKIGDSVSVVVDRKRNAVVIEQFNPIVDKELSDWTRKFIAHYRPALKALAKK